MSHFDECLQQTLAFEGGYQCLMSDAGNWTGGRVGWGTLVGTNKGISAPVLRAYVRRIRSDPTCEISAADMQSISDETVRSIYQTEFATPIRIEDLPAGPDFEIFDCCVEHGVVDTVEMAQQVAGVQIDGVVGPETIAAIVTYGPTRFVVDFSGSFLNMLQTLPQWSWAGGGWNIRSSSRLAFSTARAQATAAGSLQT